MTRWLRYLCALLIPSVALGERCAMPFFGIRVVEESTGAGVPLVELRMIHGASWVSDHAGWIAFHEPGLMDRELAWLVSGPGISYPKDGFGYACFRARSTPGTVATLRVRQDNIATRTVASLGRACIAIVSC